MKISLIITTKNEYKTIGSLFASIAKQTRIPDEVIIATADDTHRYPSVDSLKKSTVRFLPIAVDANRALGRNAAIRAAQHDLILITDAGCTLHDQWVEHLVAAAEEQTKQSFCIAGFYEGVSHNIFEKSQIPYMLVMPDRLDPSSFLPATRSMAISKAAWEKIGGFNERYKYAEDYDFARRLQAAHVPISTAANAIVYWRPREDLTSFAHMAAEHAFGDAYAGNFRIKVALIFVRHLVWIILLLSSFSLSSVWALALFTVTFGSYLVYAVKKNYRYVQHWKAGVYLPLLQIVSDFAVMIGTVGGVLCK